MTDYQDPSGPGEGPGTAPSPSAELRSLLGPVQGRLVRAGALAAASSLGLVGSLTLVGLGVDAALRMRSPNTVFWLLAGAAAAGALGFALRKLSFERSHLASFDLETVLRRDLAEHIARIPLGEVSRRGSGALKKVVHDDVRALHAAVADATPLFGAALAQPIVAVVALGIVDWRLLLAVLAIVPAVLVGVRLTTRDYAVQRRTYDEASEAINAAVVEFVQGMPVVRTFDDGSTSFGRFATRVNAFTAATKEWQDKTYASGVITRVLLTPLPTLVLLLAVGTWLVLAGQLGPAALVTALLIGTLAIETVVPLMYLSDMITQSGAGAVRIREILAVAPLPEPDEPAIPADGSVVVSGVSFSYDPTAAEPRTALRELSFEVPSGTVCALVGASGSGKSTLARLLPRFWDVTDGAIRIGGVDVRRIDTATLLRTVGLVFQEPFLVDDTIRENIRLARPEASDDEVTAVARAAQVDAFVEQLPLGYDTPVGERGGLLSGGQRQRITIARALLADPAVIVLDEATAFADPENEALIQDALARLTHGRTVLVIAHRLSTIRDADQIVVLDDGTVAERGSHDDLVARGGHYARMWRDHERAREWGLGRSELAAAQGVQA